MMLEADKLSFSFEGGKKVFQDVSFSLEKGEIDIDGRIDSFAYSDREETQKKAASFLSRMFQ